MSLHTPIQWCDSAVNPVMGCDGCELWLPSQNVFKCYAGTLHQLRGGNPGYAKDFLVPEMFAGRMAKTLGWSDLRGKERPDKPWLNGMPRLIFVSDMGDALSKDIPFEYLRDEIIVIARRALEIDRGHQYLWLTKQPGRMMKFSLWLKEQGIKWPPNLWAMTSVTGPETVKRIAKLLQVVGPAIRGVSAEPLFASTDLRFWLRERILHANDGRWLHNTHPDAANIGGTWLRGVDHVIVGGESGTHADRTEVAWLRRIVKDCEAAKVPVFCKQVGGNVVDRNDAGFEAEHHVWAEGPEAGQPVEPSAWPSPKDVEHDIDGYREEYQGAPVRIRLHDKKGGDMAEWPADLRVRQFPEVRP